MTRFPQSHLWERRKARAVSCAIPLTPKLVQAFARTRLAASVHAPVPPRSVAFETDKWATRFCVDGRAAIVPPSRSPHRKEIGGRSRSALRLETPVPARPALVLPPS